MSKRVLIFTLCFFLSLTFTSCGLFNDESLDSKLKDKVNFVSTSNNTHYIEYGNDVFLLHAEEILSIDELKDDVLLGWRGSWWGYRNQYYSQQITNPIYIYETRLDRLYLRDDYDFTKDVFVLNDTNASIVFADAIKSNYTFKTRTVAGSVDCTLYSQSYPELQILLHVFQQDSVWYVSIQGNIYNPSEHFIEILLENKVISD